MAKDKELEKKFHIRAKQAGAKFEKIERGKWIISNLEELPELKEEWEKCNKEIISGIISKDRSSVVNYTLSDEQKKEIERLWHEEDIQDLNVLTARISGNPNADGRTKIGRSIRAFLASREFSYKTTKIEELPELEIDNEIIEFIRPRYWKQTPHEIAKEFYANPSLSNLSREVRAFDKYISQLRGETISNTLPQELKELEFYDDNQELKNEKTTQSYRPPVSNEQVVYRINKYLNLEWSAKLLNREQLIQVESLKRFFRTFSFIYRVNTYQEEGDRTYFEDKFVRYVYDKPDLNQNELDGFIHLCSQNVLAEQLLRRIEEFKAIQKEEKQEFNKLTVSTNDVITSLQNDYDKCCTRITKLEEKLMTSRAARIKGKDERNASILNFFYTWQHDEQFRKRLIHETELQKKRTGEEIKRLTALDISKAMIRGATLDELIG